jgi:phosphoglucosamine mutase
VGVDLQNSTADRVSSSHWQRKYGKRLIFPLSESEVFAIGKSPNGININDGCGATDTALLQKTVVEQKADIGIALDGDADRLIMVDEKGNRIDGDQLMALLALTFKDRGQLNENSLVATVMSNLGLERFLKSHGIDTVRTPVGDRYVVEKMREGGYSLGGEQSGHIVMSDFGTTGDGLLAAIQVLGILKEKNRPASEALNLFEPLPQVLKNVRFSGGKPLENADVQKSIKDAENSLGSSGRLLVRASGTEPVIRVMAEGDDKVLVEQVVGEVCEAIEKSS